MIWDENQTRSMAVNALLVACRRYPENASMSNSACSEFTLEATAKEMTFADCQEVAIAGENRGSAIVEKHNDKDRSQRQLWGHSGTCGNRRQRRIDQRETGGKAAALGKGQEGVFRGGAGRAGSSGGLLWGGANDTNEDDSRGRQGCTSKTCRQHAADRGISVDSRQQAPGRHSCANAGRWQGKAMAKLSLTGQKKGAKKLAPE